MHRLTVTIAATLGGSPVLLRTAHVRFLAEQSRALVVALNRACLGVNCGDGTTCDNAGSCVPVDLPPSALPTWSGPPSREPPGEASGASIVGLGLGDLHSCALAHAGGVLCWGANESFELGSATRENSPVPRLLPGLINVSSIDSAAGYSCVINGDGTVSCWGLDGHGELGDAASGQSASRPDPQPVMGLAGVVQLSTGEGHACALDFNGVVYCWGANARGQLGDGTNVDRSVPVKVSGLAAAAKEVSAAETHTCARLASGQVQCWGGNEYGQLGDGMLGEDATTPQPVGGVTDAVELVSGSYHTCVVRKGRNVTCWGRNNRGQLGDGSTVDRAYPVATAALNDVRDLALGEVHSCSRSENGAVACWGGNDFGQIGDGSMTDRPAPVAVPGVHADELRAGNYHNCARRNLDAVQCWGRNDNAQLGDGTTINRAVPTVTLGLP